MHLTNKTLSPEGSGDKRDGCQTASVSNQVILAGTLTGVQGDILWKVLAALSTVK